MSKSTCKAKQSLGGSHTHDCAPGLVHDDKRGNSIPARQRGARASRGGVSDKAFSQVSTRFSQALVHHHPAHPASPSPERRGCARHVGRGHYTDTIGICIMPPPPSPRNRPPLDPPPPRCRSMLKNIINAAKPLARPFARPPFSEFSARSPAIILTNSLLSLGRDRGGATAVLHWHAAPALSHGTSNLERTLVLWRARTLAPPLVRRRPPHQCIWRRLPAGLKGGWGR
jgi:hypothetical protein